ncbi:hypothetical protein [Halarcobacter bivalviorum]|nr:hypothetical protein [Halarcobacter bivalviorum]
MEDKKEDTLTIKNLKEKLEKEKTNNSFHYISSELINLYILAKEKKITISFFEYKDDTCVIELNSLNKKSIYEFLNKYKAVINSFSYDELKGGYKANATFKSFRR